MEKDNFKKAVQGCTEIEAETLEENARMSFSHNSNLLSNSMKIMDGKYGGAFYVRYIFDSGRGCGWLQLLVEYPTGAIQTRILCKNVCKASNFDEDGIGEVLQKVEAGKSHITPQKYKPTWQFSRNVGEYEIMRDIERPDMPIPLEKLWIRIVENYEKIPVTEIQVKVSLEEVYERLLEAGEQQTEAEDRNYVLLTKEKVEQVGEACGFSLKDIRTEFALRGLWECDKNSGGYQKTVKMGNKNHRFYALKRKVSYNKNYNIVSAVNTEYDERQRTLAEDEEITKLKRELLETQVSERKMTEALYKYIPTNIPQDLLNDLV